MIELNAICKSYNRNILFDHFNLTIQPGVLTAIRGRVGSGKSTLLNILAGLDTRYDGTYSIFNQIQPKQRSLLTPYRLRHIGYIPQDIKLLDDLTCFDNIALPLKFLKVGEQQLQEMVNGVMEDFQISHLKDQYPTAISGGQRQLVSITRALVKKPSIIIGDELTGALDSTTEKMVLQQLNRRLSKETFVIIATHSQVLSEQCEKCIELL